MSLFVIVANVSAADLDGIWEGTMYCSRYDGDFDIQEEDFEAEIFQTGDFFYSVGIRPLEDEICTGVLDGNKISMTCSSGTFAYGEFKGKTMYVINHIPNDNKTCKGLATLTETE